MGTMIQICEDFVHQSDESIKRHENEMKRIMIAQKFRLKELPKMTDYCKTTGRTSSLLTGQGVGGLHSYAGHPK